MPASSIVPFLLLFSLAKAQFPAVNRSRLCPPSTFDNANASGAGFIDTSQHWSFENSTANTHLTWAMTVNEGSMTGYNNVSYPGFDTSIWIGQPPSINLHDGSNGLNGCAYILTGLPINTIERGQDDDGSCHQTFSEACVTALTNQVALALAAQWQMSSPTGGLNSNPTQSVLDSVCGAIDMAMGAYARNVPVPRHFPAECLPYFDTGSPLGTPNVEVLQITSNTTDAFQEGCSVENSTTLPGYLLSQLIISQQNTTGNLTRDNEIYDNATRTVIPVLSVFMPTANNSGESIKGGPWAAMTCLRASHFRKGSRVPPPLPSAKPVHFPHRLSKGAKAGIAVGVAVSVVLIGVAIWFFFMRTRGQMITVAVAPGNADGRGLATRRAGKEKYEMNPWSRGERLGTPVTNEDSRPSRDLEGEVHRRNWSPLGAGW